MKKIFVAAKFDKTAKIYDLNFKFIFKIYDLFFKFIQIYDLFFRLLKLSIGW